MWKWWLTLLLEVWLNKNEFTKEELCILTNYTIFHLYFHSNCEMNWWKRYETNQNSSSSSFYKDDQIVWLHKKLIPEKNQKWRLRRMKEGHYTNPLILSSEQLQKIMKIMYSCSWMQDCFNCSNICDNRIVWLKGWEMECALYHWLQLPWCTIGLLGKGD